ncbi:twin-arginine translocase TatA/TatE family subunit [Ornithinimicrobium sp. W1679]|uniref:Sec-independent protein translocase subunit TatA n=1 Tax=unclassified Ornithinimicrobium TaxID=2615080 RepID=UPI003CEEDECA
MRIQIWHIVVLIVAFVLLFGWKNLPNVSRSLGESMRVFKSEVDQMKDENEARKGRSQDSALPGGDDDVAGRAPRDDRGTRDGDRYRDTAREEYRELRDGDGEPDGRDDRGPRV